jgi:hypothetical protein
MGYGEYLQAVQADFLTQHEDVNVSPVPHADLCVAGFVTL